MSSDVLPAPALLINLPLFRELAKLRAGDNSALDAAIARVTAEAEDEDVNKICAFNSAL